MKGVDFMYYTQEQIDRPCIISEIAGRGLDPRRE